MADKIGSLDCFFRPKSIAIIGASHVPGKIGYELLRNLELSKFPGYIFPINPNSASVMGLKAFKSILDVRSAIDLAVIAIPAESVSTALDQCIKAQAKGVVIISSGFGEIGKIELERELVEKAKAAGVRLIGPNTFGIYCAKSQMNCTFGPQHILPGKTALITQSGALGLALMAWTTEERYGVSSVVSVGNKADVDDADLLEYFGQDDSTENIMIYMEGIKNGRRFYEVAKKIVHEKPIVVLKAGKSRRGAIAISSHTGAIAGQDRIFDVAFKEAGVLRAGTMTRAFDWLQSINENPIPNGDKIAIITNGGGVGVLATDRCEELNLTFADFSNELKDELRSVIPNFGSVRNPIDLTANSDPVMYSKILKILFEQEEIHGIIALLCETANFDPIMVSNAITSVAGNQRMRKKAITMAFVGGHLANEALRVTIDKGVAAYPTAERAVDGMFAVMDRYRKMRSINSLDPLK